jgi:hypothetical protein
MGTGGATALESPEGQKGRAQRPRGITAVARQGDCAHKHFPGFKRLRLKSALLQVSTKKNKPPFGRRMLRFSDIYIQEASLAKASKFSLLKRAVLSFGQLLLPLHF